MSKFIAYSLEDEPILKAYNVDIRKPSMTALKRQLNCQDTRVILEASRVMQQLVQTQEKKACQEDEQVKNNDFKFLRGRLRRYCRNQSVLYGISKDKSLTKVMQGSMNTVDLMTKYNRQLAIKMHNVLTGDTIEDLVEKIQQYKENLNRWYSDQRQNILTSPNFKQMNHRFRKTHKSASSQLDSGSIQRKSTEMRRLYTALSTTRKKLW